MPHINFHEFKAKDNYELGSMMGQRFADLTKETVYRASVFEIWKTKVERAKLFLKFNQEYFPEYVEEIRGYAKGAGVEFLGLYTLSLEDEVGEDFPNERCTTMITNNPGRAGGILIAHNEDWDKGSEDKICIVSKQIGALKILELYYYNTLGGNSVSINSNGFITCINSLVSTKTKIGLSKNVIARWLSETKDLDKDFEKLKELPRSMGYSGNIVSPMNNIRNIEYNSESAIMTRPASPFVHTNHYLTPLKEFEGNTNKNGTFSRYAIASEKIKPTMSFDELNALTNNQTDGHQLSIMNERTIAKIIIDTHPPAGGKIAKIWLLREPELGFVDYPLVFN